MIRSESLPVDFGFFCGSGGQMMGEVSTGYVPPAQVRPQAPPAPPKPETAAPNTRPATLPSEPPPPALYGEAPRPQTTPVQSTNNDHSGEGREDSENAEENNPLVSGAIAAVGSALAGLTDEQRADITRIGDRYDVLGNSDEWQKLDDYIKEMQQKGATDIQIASTLTDKFGIGLLEYYYEYKNSNTCALSDAAITRAFHIETSKIFSNTQKNGNLVRYFNIYKDTYYNSPQDAINTYNRLMNGETMYETAEAIKNHCYLAVEKRIQHIQRDPSSTQAQKDEAKKAYGNLKKKGIIDCDLTTNDVLFPTTKITHGQSLSIKTSPGGEELKFDFDFNTLHKLSEDWGYKLTARDFEEGRYTTKTEGDTTTVTFDRPMEGKIGQMQIELTTESDGTVKVSIPRYGWSTVYGNVKYVVRDTNGNTKEVVFTQNFLKKIYTDTSMDDAKRIAFWNKVRAATLVGRTGEEGFVYETGNVYEIKILGNLGDFRLMGQADVNGVVVFNLGDAKGHTEAGQWIDKNKNNYYKGSEVWQDIPSVAQSGQDIKPEQAQAVRAAAAEDGSAQQDIARQVSEGLLDPQSRFADSQVANSIGKTYLVDDVVFESNNIEKDAISIKNEDGKYDIYIRRSAAEIDQNGLLTRAACSRLTRAAVHEITEIGAMIKNPNMDAGQKAVAAHWVATQVEEAVTSRYAADPGLGIKAATAAGTVAVMTQLESAARGAPSLGDTVRGSHIAGASMGFGLSLAFELVPEIWNRGFDNVGTAQYWRGAIGRSWDSAIRAAAFSVRDNSIQDVFMQRIFGTNYADSQLWNNSSVLSRIGFTGANVGAMAISGIFDDVLLWLDSPIDERLRDSVPQNIKKNSDLADIDGNPYIREYFDKMVALKMIQGSASNMAFEIPQLLATRFPLLRNTAARAAAGVATNFITRSLFEYTVLSGIAEEYLGKNENEPGLIQQYQSGEIGEPTEDLGAFYQFTNDYFTSFVAKERNAEVLRGIGDFIKSPLAASYSTWLVNQAINLGRRAIGMSKASPANGVLTTAFATYQAGKFSFNQGNNTSEDPREYFTRLGVACIASPSIIYGTGWLTGTTVALSAPASILVGGLAFTGGVAYQIIDQQNKILEESDYADLDREQKNKILGVARATNGWISGRESSGAIESIEEARSLYPGLPSSQLQNIVTLSKIGYKNILGHSIDKLDPGQDTTYGGARLVLGTKNEVIGQSLKEINNRFALGHWSGNISEEDYIDSVCPNWRYLVSNQSGQRERFSSNLWNIYESATVQKFIKRNDDEGVIARNMADYYMNDPNLISVSPRDLWDRLGISPVIEKSDLEETARVYADYMGQLTSFIGENISEDSLTLISTSVDKGETLTDNQMGYFISEAVGNFLTLDNILDMSFEDKVLLRRAGFEDGFYVDSVRRHHALWAEVKDVLSRDGILAQECASRGVDYANIDSLDANIFNEIMQSAIAVFRERHGLPWAEAEQRIIPERALIEKFQEIKNAPEEQTKQYDSLENFAYSNKHSGRAIPIINIKEYPRLFAELNTLFRQRGQFDYTDEALRTMSDVDFARVYSDVIKEICMHNNNGDIGETQYIDANIINMLTSIYVPDDDTENTA